jgi:hypothetical protein
MFGKSSMLQYCKLVARTAAHGVISRASFIISVLSLITGTALWLAPDFGMIIDASDLQAMLRSPKFYAGVVALVILFNLIFAQFQIWKADQKTISALSENLSAGRRRRNKNIAKLQEFWVAVGPIITRPLLKDISDDDFNKYHEEANALAIDCTTWIAENMGVPAREKFLDRTGMQGVVLGGVNDTHNYIVKNLTILRQNLQNIIENYDAWDANRE